MLTIKRTLITKGSVLLGASIFMVGFVGTLGTLTALGVAQNPSSTPAVAVSDHQPVKKESKEATSPTPQPSGATQPTAAAASSNMMTPLASSNSTSSSTNSSVSPKGSAITYGTEQAAPSSNSTSTTSTSTSSQPSSQSTTTSPTPTATSSTCTTLLPTVNTVLSSISKC